MSSDMFSVWQTALDNDFIKSKHVVIKKQSVFISGGDGEHRVCYKYTDKNNGRKNNTFLVFVLYSSLNCTEISLCNVGS
jgi:hypothetical protein